MLIDEELTAKTRLAKYCSRIEDWFTARTVLTVGLLAALVALVKSGLDGFETAPIPSDLWPQPLPGYPFFSYGIRAIAWMTSPQTQVHYTVMGMLLVLATLFLGALIIDRSVKNLPGRLTALVLLGGPIVWILAGRVGHPDAFAILGGLILGLLGRRVWWAVSGAVVASIGSPEQAAVKSLSLLIVSASPALRAWRRGAFLALSFSLVAWSGLTLWSSMLNYESRLLLLPELLGLSFERFFLHFPLIMYTGFGLTLPLIVLAALVSTRRGAVLIFIGAIGVPLFFTLVTMDQSRILAIAAAASSTAIASRYAGLATVLLQQTVRYPLTLIAGLLLFLPALDVTGNILRQPWERYFPYLQIYVIDRIPFI